MGASNPVVIPARSFINDLLTGNKGTGYLVATALCAISSAGALVVYGFAEGDGWQAFAQAIMVGLAAFWVGGLVGFIFGLGNQRNDGKRSTERAGPLGEISDWLTKVLVGVGLVEIGSIAGGVQSLGHYFGSGIDIDDGPVLLTAFLVQEMACGFWFLYFWTVTRWSGLAAHPTSNDRTHR